MTHYPIDDLMFGLNEEQSAVSSGLCYQVHLFLIHTPINLKLRQTVFNFAQKELAPFAYEIDINNEFLEEVGQPGFARNHS